MDRVILAVTNACFNAPRRVVIVDSLLGSIGSFVSSSNGLQLSFVSKACNLDAFLLLLDACCSVCVCILICGDLLLFIPDDAGIL